MLFPLVSRASFHQKSSAQAFYWKFVREDAIVTGCIACVFVREPLREQAGAKSAPLDIDCARLSRTSWYNWFSTNEKTASWEGRVGQKAI